MKVFFQDRDISTKNGTEFMDITNFVEETMRKSGVTSGICIVRSVHSTIAKIVNEHEADLIRYYKKVQRDFPKGTSWLYDRVMTTRMPILHRPILILAEHIFY